MKLHLTCWIAFVLWSHGIESSAAGAPRLAIWSAHDDLLVYGDLLTTALSQSTNVVVLERTEIKRVMSEAQLSASASSDPFSLGRLLNTEGVIFLERKVAGTNELLSIRLVTVGPGVILSDDAFVLPVRNASEWSTQYATHLASRLPKLAVSKKDALPLSVLNLRSSLPTAEGLNLERELTSLLHARLTRETSIFLLERRSLDEIQDEKLTDAAPESFWSGAYLLDGVINRDEVSVETVTIHARVIPPKGEPRNVLVRGRRAEAPLIVDELARKIREAINGTTSIDWHPAKEAQQYAREALWNLQWSRFPEAAKASDASWHLGERTPMVAAMRVVTRARQGLAMRAPWPFEGADPYGFRRPPASGAIEHLSRALEIYHELTPMFTSSTNQPYIGWGSIGIDILRSSSLILCQFQQNIEFTQGIEEPLERLRAQCRGVNDLLTTNRLLGPARWKRNLQGLPGIPLNLTGNQTGPTITGPSSELWSAWLDSAGSWFDSPNDALALFQRLLEPKTYGTVRRSFLQYPMPISGWTINDRKRLHEIWSEFLLAMSKSSHLQIRLDGLRLYLNHCINPNDLETATRKFADEAWNARYAIFSKTVDCPVDIVLDNLARRIDRWGRPEVATILDLKTNWLQRFSAAGPDLSFEAWRKLITNLTNKSLRTFSFSTPTIPPRPEQLRQLLRDFESIASEGPQQEIRIHDHWEQLKKLADSDHAHRTAAVSIGNAPLATSSVTAKLTRAWTGEDVMAPPNRIFWDHTIKNPCWHENRLWIESSTRREMRTFSGTRPALIAWDPATGRSELVEAPYEGDYHPEAPRFSLLLHDKLYLSSDGALWLKDGPSPWRSIPLPSIGWGVPVAYGKRIIISAENTILEVDPATSSVHILASTRRNPAQNRLDRAASLKRAPLVVWPDGTLRALVDGKVWRYDDKGLDWVPTHSGTNCGEFLSLHSDRILYRQSIDCGPGLLGGWSSTSDALDYYTVGTSRPNQPIGQTPAFTPPTWISPAECQPFERAIAFERSGLWVFPKKILNNKYDGFLRIPKSSDLVYFDHRYRRGLRIGLETPASETGLKKLLTEAPDNLNRPVEFLITPSGLAVLFRHQERILWYSRANLQAALAEAAAVNPEPSITDPETNLKFDRDNNGWMDGAERLAARLDPGWQARHRTLLETSIQRRTQEHAAEWDRLFNTLDANKDGKLSAVEMAPSLTNHLSLLADRLSGVNCALGYALKPYDLTADNALNRIEFRDFLADPRNLAEMNCSPDWVTRFGLKPADCDTNRNGTIDAGERQLINKLIRSRPALQTRTTEN